MSSQRPSKPNQKSKKTCRSKFTAQVIEIADGAYSDGLIGLHYKDDQDVGDLLAEFIAHEISSATSGCNTRKTALRAAVKAMNSARDQVHKVWFDLFKALDVEEKKK